MYLHKTCQSRSDQGERHNSPEIFNYISGKLKDTPAWFQHWFLAFKYYSPPPIKALNGGPTENF